jgi:hypothetical protein
MKMEICKLIDGLEASDFDAFSDGEELAVEPDVVFAQMDALLTICEDDTTRRKLLRLQVLLTDIEFLRWKIVKELASIYQ